MAVWLSGNALVSINEVTVHWDRLVLGWVTMSVVHVTNHPAQLSLAIPSWVDVVSTSVCCEMPVETMCPVVILCSWGVKAGMVHEWLGGKTM